MALSWVSIFLIVISMCQRVSSSLLDKTVQLLWTPAQRYQQIIPCGANLPEYIQVFVYARPSPYGSKIQNGCHPKAQSLNNVKYPSWWRQDTRHTTWSLHFSPTDRPGMGMEQMTDLSRSKAKQSVMALRIVTGWNGRSTKTRPSFVSICHRFTATSNKTSPTRQCHSYWLTKYGTRLQSCWLEWLNIPHQQSAST